MKTSGISQYSFGLMVAALLVFLFIQSQFDGSYQRARMIELLTLIDHDSQIRQQIIELKLGNKKNYGGLAAHQQAIRQGLIDFEKKYETSLIAASVEARNMIEHLQNQIDVWFDEIEKFKGKHAVLRNTLQFLPKLIDDLDQQIDLDSSLSSEDRLAAKLNLQQLKNRALSIATASSDQQQGLVKSFAQIHQALWLLLDQHHQPLLLKISRQLALISTLSPSVEDATRALLSDRSKILLHNLYDRFNRDFKSQQQQADQYRIWLFIVAISLLLYLAYTFFRLQSTSSRLAESLRDLEFHKSAIDEHAIISITDVQGRIIYANQKFCDISQYSLDELVGNTHRILKSGIHDEAFYRQMWRTIAQGRVWQGEFSIKAKDGSIYWVESTLLPRLDDQGKPFQYIGIRTDISARKEAEKKAALLARFPAENPDPVMRLDLSGRLIFANQASQLLLNHWHTGIHQHLPKEWIQVAKRVHSNQQQEEHELNVGKVYFSILFAPIASERYVNLYARDISAIKRAEQHLNYQATHDALTSLRNRYAFEMALEDTLIDTRQNQTSSILLYLDLDQFKIVNDTCGHIAGDELLRQVSLLFESSVRDSDILARLGGDEFGIILNHCELQFGEHIARELLEKLKEYRFMWDDKSFEVGASIGIVVIDRDCDSIVSLMGHADVACYAAKDAGRNRLQIFRNDQAVEQQQQEIQWASRIPTALSKNQFVLYGQLIEPLNASAENNTHYEMLLRLQEDDDSLIPPGAFIPAAERYGLMQSIDVWVISHAIEALGQHIQQYPDSRIRIGVNLSGQSIGNEHLLQFIPDLLLTHGLAPDFVTLEITETAAITNLTQAIKFIKQLKQNGHYFALDDFGSGLSSFSYLKNLPVDFLKIDGAFVKDILQDPIDAAMVQAINQIGHVMNIGTIAEFVENEEIKKRLQLIGIDYAQGYHIEKPRPFSEILADDAAKFSLASGNHQA